eukprot:sb/3471981/
MATHPVGRAEDMLEISRAQQDHIARATLIVKCELWIIKPNQITFPWVIPPFSQLLALLVKSGANVNAKNREGQTALFAAVKHRNIHAAKHLIGSILDDSSETLLKQCSLNAERNLVRDIKEKLRKDDLKGRKTPFVVPYDPTNTITNRRSYPRLSPLDALPWKSYSLFCDRYGH